MRKKRLGEIISIIREKEIENQDILIRELKIRGYNVTQATVSRDINELKLEKSLSENGVNCYTLPKSVENIRFNGIFNQSAINIDYALNTVVVKCHTGLANAACAAIDTMNITSIVGTVAGDDTIFILTRTEKDAQELSLRLTDMI